MTRWKKFNQTYLVQTPFTANSVKIRKVVFFIFLEIWSLYINCRNHKDIASVLMMSVFWLFISVVYFLPGRDSLPIEIYICSIIIIHHCDHLSATR